MGWLEAAFADWRKIFKNYLLWLALFGFSLKQTAPERIYIINPAFSSVYSCAENASYTDAKFQFLRLKIDICMLRFHCTCFFIGLYEDIIFFVVHADTLSLKWISFRLFWAFWTCYISWDFFVSSKQLKRVFFFSVLSNACPLMFLLEKTFQTHNTMCYPIVTQSTN